MVTRSGECGVVPVTDVKEAHYSGERSGECGVVPVTDVKEAHYSGDMFR